MLDRAALRNLRRLTGNEENSLTLYLDIDQTKPANRNGGHITQAEAMVKDIRAANPGDVKLEAASNRVLELVHRLKPRGKTALIVTQPGETVSEAHQIRVAIAPVGLQAVSPLGIYSSVQGGGKQ